MRQFEHYLYGAKELMEESVCQQRNEQICNTLEGGSGFSPPLEGEGARGGDSIGSIYSLE